MDGQPVSAHDLDVDDAAQPVAHLDQRLDRHQPVLRGGVDVGADGGGAVGEHQPRRPLGALDRVVER